MEEEGRMDKWKRKEEWINGRERRMDKRER
jgi:hypothetical protein